MNTIITKSSLPNTPPIDFVILWVDGNDPIWLAEKHQYEILQPNYNTPEFQQWINAKSRYRDWDNLRYWFRAVEKYAPWVHQIHFVTYGHLPEWLNTAHPKLHVVRHTDFIPPEYLPTFNSNTIELNLHRIPNLAQQFVYFNDDMFLNNYVKPTDFFKHGVPCEVAGWDCIKPNYLVHNLDINNIRVLSRYFQKRNVIKQHWRKWFKLRYGKYLFKTILLSYWKDITGLAESHTATSHLKSDFDLIWQKEYQKCHTTCLNKFRNDNDITHWLVKGYRLLSGNFSPRSGKFGQNYNQPVDQTIVNEIIKHKHCTICINDFECSEADFIRQKNLLQSAFQQVLPQPSSFEKGTINTKA